jgi:alpha-beta hydrolase superfamily lysophospholipase
MQEETGVTSGANGSKLFLRKWLPDEGQKARAAVCLLHGMAEHSGRYAWIAGKLVEEGFAVWAYDQRGHGHTAADGFNPVAEGGSLGHCADKNAPEKVLDDLDAFIMQMHEAYPALPVFLLGHSWGSFIAQLYIEAHSEHISGCILSGTNCRQGGIFALGGVILPFFVLFRGVRARSKFINGLSGGAFNARFRPNRTPLDWCSRDEADVDEHLADPFCQQLSSVGFFRDTVRICKKTGKKREMEKIRRDLPVYIISGSMDPVGDFGAGPLRLVRAYQAELGMKNIEYVIYPGARHELFHETNKEEAAANVIKWLKKTVSQISKIDNEGTSEVPLR